MILEINHVREEVKGDPRFDNLLERRMKAVISEWETLTNRHWTYRENSVEMIKPDHSQSWLYLKLFPFTDIKVETWSAGQSPTTDAIELDVDSQYIADYENGVISRRDGMEVPAGWPLFYGSGRVWPEIVRVTVTGGYTSETISPKITEVLITQLKYQMAKNTMEVITTKSKGMQGNSTSFMKQAYHPDFESLAKYYKRKVC